MQYSEKNHKEAMDILDYLIQKLDIEEEEYKESSEEKIETKNKKHT